MVANTTVCFVQFLGKVLLERNQSVTSVVPKVLIRSWVTEVLSQTKALTPFMLRALREVRQLADPCPVVLKLPVTLPVPSC